jgi:hypothetical protein
MIRFCSHGRRWARGVLVYGLVTWVAGVLGDAPARVLHQRQRAVVVFSAVYGIGSSAFLMAASESSSVASSRSWYWVAAPEPPSGIGSPPSEPRAKADLWHPELHERFGAAGSRPVGGTGKVNRAQQSRRRRCSRESGAPIRGSNPGDDRRGAVEPTTGSAERRAHEREPRMRAPPPRRRLPTVTPRSATARRSIASSRSAELPRRLPASGSSSTARARTRQAIETPTASSCTPSTPRRFVSVWR